MSRTPLFRGCPATVVSVVLSLLVGPAPAQAQENRQQWVATWGTAQPLVAGTGLPGGERGAQRGGPPPVPAPRTGPQRRFVSASHRFLMG